MPSDEVSSSTPRRRSNSTAFSPPSTVYKEACANDDTVPTRRRPSLAYSTAPPPWLRSRSPCSRSDAKMYVRCSSLDVLIPQ